MKEPVFTGKMEGTLLWRLAWNSYNQIATGCTNGLSIIFVIFLVQVICVVFFSYWDAYGVGHICLWNLESDLSGVKSRSVSAQE